MVAPAVRRGGRKPKPLSSLDPHCRRAVFELVSKLAREHIARMWAVTPVRPSGSGRVLDDRPADAIDDLLDVTDVGVVLSRGSVERDHARLARIGIHHASKLKGRSSREPTLGACVEVRPAADCLARASPFARVRLLRSMRGGGLRRTGPTAASVPIGGQTMTMQYWPPDFPRSSSLAGQLRIPLPGFELCCVHPIPSVYRGLRLDFTRWGQPETGHAAPKMPPASRQDSSRPKTPGGATLRLALDDPRGPSARGCAAEISSFNLRPRSLAAAELGLPLVS